MAYHEYRKAGLPLTSAHIGSTIKQINRRIKGTEKFWLSSMNEFLQLRADGISDSRPSNNSRRAGKQTNPDPIDTKVLAKLHSKVCTPAYDLIASNSQTKTAERKSHSAVCLTQS